jgi:membrane protein
MSEIRRILLLIIAAMSGAWLGADALKARAKDTGRARAAGPAPRPAATAGAKNGASLSLPWPGRRHATPSPGTTDRSGKGFLSFLKKRGDDKSEPKIETETKPVSAPGAAPDAHRDMSKIHGPFGYVMELFKRFGADHCPAWAAALSFFSILSLPFILLAGLWVLGEFISPAEATDRIKQLLTSVLPGGGTGANEQADLILRQLNVEKSLQQLHEQRGIAGIIGVGSLFWSAMQIFLNAATPMNAAFRTEETRGWLKIRGYALGLLLGAGLLFLLALVPSSIAQVLNTVNVPIVGELQEPILGIVFTLLGVLINAAMFAVIYRYLPSPSAGVDWREARFAGIIVAVLWEIAKQGFAWYLGEFGQKGYNKVYGSLGGAVALVFWIYYTSMILLLGAEICKLYSDVREAKGQK